MSVILFSNLTSKSACCLFLHPEWLFDFLLQCHLQVLSGSNINLKSWKFSGGLRPQTPKGGRAPVHSRSSIGGTSRGLTREASRTICCFAPDSAPLPEILATPLNKFILFREKSIYISYLVPHFTNFTKNTSKKLQPCNISWIKLQ